MTRVLTYGTFDLFHIGHLKILERLAALGDELYVGVSTDEFNAGKGKRSLIAYEQRAEIVGALKCVTKVIPENDWAQKRRDIVEFGIDVLGMGHDWTGKFDDLGDLCRVVYLPRTDGISSTQIRSILSPLSADRVRDLKNALDLVTEIVEELAPNRPV